MYLLFSPRSYTIYSYRKVCISFLYFPKPGGSQPRRNFFGVREEKQSMQKESFVKRYGLLIGTGYGGGYPTPIFGFSR